MGSTVDRANVTVTVQGRSENRAAGPPTAFIYVALIVMHVFFVFLIGVYDIAVFSNGADTFCSHYAAL